jgi:ABC-type multidrug transport system fused ATPase/permease subunit
MEPYERRRFLEETQNYYEKSMRIVRLEALTSPTMEMVGVTAITLALFIGASLVIGENDYARTHVFGVKMADSPMDLQTLVTLFTLLAGISDPVRKLSNVYGRVQRAEAAADRILGFLDRKPTIVDREDATRLARHRLSVELKDIEFSYGDSAPVLKGINLRVRAGETIALVGPNGCGKTTLMNLIPRFYDPQCGQVLIDGLDVRDVQIRSLRRQIGVVTQETVLFNDTILNNIAYGNRCASRAEIELAARKAHAHRFIEELPQGYETNVGERAVKLSGGQRQRIALARAILRDPAILILDEATSALDGPTEAAIQETLRKVKAGRTTLVIAHRLSTIVDADLILVLRRGRIVERGTHAELLDNQGEYAALWRRQTRES